MRTLQTQSSDKLRSMNTRLLNERVRTGHSLDEKPPLTFILVTVRMGFHVGGARGALPIAELGQRGRAPEEDGTALGRNSCGPPNAPQAGAASKGANTSRTGWFCFFGAACALP